MNTKKVLLYCLFAFGISWLTALALHLSGTSYGSGFSKALVALLFMPGPAFATLIVQKGIYKEPLAAYGFRIKGISIKWILLIPLIFLGLLGLTYLCIYLGSFFEPGFGQLIFSSDFIHTRLAEMLAAQGMEGIKIPQIPLITFISTILISGIIAAYSINIPFMLGEELGWRGLMTEETRRLGFWKSNLLIGTVWGLWHAPLILLGHNYPTYPYVGIGVMVAFTVSLSFLFAYLRYKTHTVLGPCIIHGLINGIAALFLFTIADAHELLGSMVGVAGIAAAFVITLFIALFDRKFIRAYSLPENIKPSIRKKEVQPQTARISR